MTSVRVKSDSDREPEEDMNGSKDAQREQGILYKTFCNADFYHFLAYLNMPLVNFTDCPLQSLFKLWL